MHTILMCDLAHRCGVSVLGILSSTRKWTSPRSQHRQALKDCDVQHACKDAC